MARLEYNNAPNPSLPNVSSYFNSASALLNDALQRGRSLALGFNQRAQDEQTANLYREAAAAYNNLDRDSYNNWLRAAASDTNRFGRVASGVWQDLQGNNRTTVNQQLLDDIEARQKAIASAYNTAANVAFNNADQKGLRQANAAMLGARDVNGEAIRYDLLKPESVDTLMNSAAKRGLLGAETEAARARAAQARAAAKKTGQDILNDELYANIQNEYDQSYTRVSGSEANINNVALMRRILEKYERAGIKLPPSVIRKALDYTHDSEGNKILFGTDFPLDDSYISGEPENVVSADYQQTLNDYANGTNRKRTTTPEDVPTVETPRQPTEAEVRARINNDFAAGWIKLDPYAAQAGGMRSPGSSNPISGATIDGVTAGLPSETQNRVFNAKKNTAVGVEQSNRILSRGGIFDKDQVDNLTANVNELIDSYANAIDMQTGTSGAMSVITTAFNSAEASVPVKNFFNNLQEAKKGTSPSVISKQLQEDLGLDSSDRDVASRYLSKYSGDIPKEAIVQAIYNSTEYSGGLLGEGSHINQDKLDKLIDTALAVTGSGSSENNALRAFSTVIRKQKKIQNLSESYDNLYSQFESLKRKSDMGTASYTDLMTLDSLSNSLRKISLQLGEAQQDLFNRTTSK